MNVYSNSAIKDPNFPPLTLWRPPLSYVYSYKTFCSRPG